MLASHSEGELLVVFAHTVLRGLEETPTLCFGEGDAKTLCNIGLLDPVVTLRWTLTFARLCPGNPRLI